MGSVLDGDWDSIENLYKLEEIYFVKGLKQRFEEKIEWEKTQYIKAAKESFLKGKKYWGYESLKEFLDKRCGYVDKLYEEIKHNGYSPECKDKNNKNIKDFHRSVLKQQLEPLVVISRNGEIILFDGFHRTTIAAILGLEIPVNVAFRHKRWQDLRDKIYNKKSLKELDLEDIKHLEHPDMKDLID